jgi:hypothetical protein
MQARFAALSIPFVLLALVHCSSSSEEGSKVTPAPTADGGGDAKPPTDAPDAGNTVDAAVARLASMKTPRSLFAAVNGKDARIRTFGGLTVAGLDDTTETFDPIANTWTKAAGTSSVRRYGHSATQDATGRVFVLGGTSDGQAPIGVAEIFSPSDGTWTTIADLPTPRLGVAAATGKDGRVYAIGGRDASGAASDVVEIYAADTQSWSPGPSLPTKRLALVAVTGADGKIYAMGGRDSNNTPLGVVEAFDSDKGAWETVASLKTARYWFGATLAADGKIYVLGGIDTLGFLDEAEVLTPGAGWSALPAMPEARGWVAAGASADGRVFAMGGGTPGDALPGISPPPTHTILAFDTKSGTWKQ